MPLYDYECQFCGPILNVWAKMNEQELPCQVCGVNQMHRVISASIIAPDWTPYFDENLAPMHGRDKW